MFALATTRARPGTRIRSSALHPARARPPQRKQPDPVAATNAVAPARWNFATIPTFSPSRGVKPGAGASGWQRPQRCAACEQDETSHRIPSDSMDNALQYPRQEGSDAMDAGFTPAPAPPVFPPQPSPPPAPAPAANCCADALSAGLDGGDWGGIICCNNVKKACVWQSNINKKVTNSSAQSIVGGCVLAHERTHLNQVDCTGAKLERPPFKPGVDPNAAECNAYKTEASCYDNNISKCGGDADCTAQVQTEWDFAKKQIAKYC